MVFLGNSFSLGMLLNYPAEILVEQVTLNEAREILSGGFVSIVGHADTAAIFSGLLGVPVEFNRVTAALRKGAVLMVGQYLGPRLPEGTKSLPVGASLLWLRITIR